MAILQQSPVCEVYPRVCGGTRLAAAGAIRAEGLSPRVRGNRRILTTRIRRGRSIPACAGEPAHWVMPMGSSSVYPRVCGGTAHLRHHLSPDGGLSPRVRGNPIRHPQCERRKRSIPACAGEPVWHPQVLRPGAVYPRVCGGTAWRRMATARAAGLSPRVRGNPLRLAGELPLAGSIPACAGEPRRACGIPSSPRVYPRVCGGTSDSESGDALAQGLSPRVRGNRDTGAAAHRPPGSIPACAGEPVSYRIQWCQGGVYPRVCGGTGCAFQGAACAKGLSPRVRGNRLFAGG